MKTDKPVKNRKGRNTVFVMAAALIMIVFTPANILDILVTVNFFLSLVIFLAVVFTGSRCRAKDYEKIFISKETTILSDLLVVLLFCAVFGFTIYAAFTRLVLTKGVQAGNKIITAVSGLVSAGGTAGIVAGFAGLMIACVVMVFATRGFTRITEVSFRFAQDATPGAMMAIESIYTSGEISEEVCSTWRSHIKKQVEFLAAMDGMGKFIAGKVKIGIFIMAAGVLGGIIIGTELHGRTIQKAAEVSIAFGITGVVIFLLPLLLLSIAASIVSISVGKSSTNINGEGRI